jgi:hypothetical protein
MKKALFLFLAISSFNIAKAGDGKFKEKMKDFLNPMKDDTDSTTVVEEKKPFPIDIAGSVDVYTQTNFLGKVTNNVYHRAFYPKANAFNLGMFNLMMSKKIGKVGFMADIGFGPRAEAANNTIYANSIIAIKQLYVTYAPAEFVDITFGNFSTFFGYELIEPQNNFNYSTSLAFQNGPFYHTGIKANFKKDKFNFLVGFFNDTDTKDDEDRNKYVGAQLGYTGDNGGVYVNFVGGNEPSTYMVGEDEISAFKNYKHSYDLTGSIKLGEEKKGKLGVNAALHSYRYKALKDDEASKATYYTTYLYGQYDITERGSIGGRVGYFNDADGVAAYVIGGAKSYLDFTLTAQAKIGNLRFIPELRFDVASEPVFFKRDGSVNSKLQTVLGMAAVYSF